ncbi:corrinoid methyltransferase [Clostridia bacterium]|nr:corrinoid methyltransferase [Clostridia bacterium]
MSNVILDQISEAVQKGKARDTKELVQKAIAEKIGAKDILDKGLLAAMAIVGKKFKNNEVFVPEVLISARALNMGTAELKPYLAAQGVKPLGKAIICTVKGDLHDIGKNLVRMMLEGVGLEVQDLGVDVAPEKIVEAVKTSDAKVLCLSALLTTTMGAQKDTIDALAAAGVRDKIKIMVGGAPVTEEYAKQIGADAYTSDAASAATAAKLFF